MKISAKTGNVAFYAFMPSLGFFVLSMLAWKGFYIAEAQFPNIEYMPSADFQKYVVPLYWENYVLLAVTIISLIIAVACVVIYFYSDTKIK